MHQTRGLLWSSLVLTCTSRRDLSGFQVLVEGYLGPLDQCVPTYYSQTRRLFSWLYPVLTTQHLFKSTFSKYRSPSRRRPLLQPAQVPPAGLPRKLTNPQPCWFRRRVAEPEAAGQRTGNLGSIFHVSETDFETELEARIEMMLFICWLPSNKSRRDLKKRPFPIDLSGTSLILKPH